MKVSYPLSLKVSGWLMLNLLLLAVLGMGFFIVNGGLRWDALVSGPSGARMQSLANIIAGEASAATGEARQAVLKRFSAAYGAEFYLFSAEEGQLAGTPVELPAPVRARVDFRGPRGSGGGPGFSSRGDFRHDRPLRGVDENARAPEPTDKAERDTAARGVHDAGEKTRREGGRPASPEMGGRSGFYGFGDFQSGRFVVRAGSPVAYWVGARVALVLVERGRPIPARVIIRVNSLWSLLHLLNLQSWMLAGTGVLLLSILFWVPLVRGITRSLGQLTVATEQIAQGRFETRVEAARRDELGQLGDSVNRMAARLEAHMGGQKRFLGDVAHELCSPLARLQVASGILAEEAPEKLQATVADLREEVQQMSTLVNELLAFTKAGLKSRDIVLQPLAVRPLAQQMLQREGATDRVDILVPDTLHAMADPELLSRALANLVRNALRYGGPGRSVITGEMENGRAVVAVEDDGPGIASTDLDRLGEPFFRPELARTREGGGVGLGLAIVRSSVTACGGEVRFSNRVPHGFRAEIRLTSAVQPG